MNIFRILDFVSISLQNLLSEQELRKLQILMMTNLFFNLGDICITREFAFDHPLNRKVPRKKTASTVLLVLLLSTVLASERVFEKQAGAELCQAQGSAKLTAS